MEAETLGVFPVLTFLSDDSKVALDHFLLQKYAINSYRVGHLPEDKALSGLPLFLFTATHHDLSFHIKVRGDLPAFCKEITGFQKETGRKPSAT